MIFNSKIWKFENLEIQLAANVRFYSELLGGEMEAGGTVHAVAVEQRHGSGAVLSADFNQFLRQGSTFEEGECGARVEFDVHKRSQ